MTSNPEVATVVILLAAIVVFIWNRVSPAIVALGVTIALFATGVVDFGEAISGFGDPLVIYLAGLFVVSEALDASGVTAWAGAVMTRLVGQKPAAIMSAVMVLCAVLAAFITPNGAVAALIPVAVLLAARIGQAPSRMLIPLAFAAHAGSMLTLLGTPINVLVSELAEENGARAFGFFEFAIVGVPLLVGVVLICVVLGPRLLPERWPANATHDLSHYAQTIAAEYQLSGSDHGVDKDNGIIEVVIPPRSPFLGDEVYPGMFTEDGDLIITAVHRNGKLLDHADLEVGDVLLLHGTWEDLQTKVTRGGILSVNEPDLIRRQTGHLGARAWISSAVLVIMCVSLALDVAPPAIVVLCAAAALVAMNVVTVPQAERSISLQTLIVVGGMVPMSIAIQTSGLAQRISTWMVDTLGGGSPLLLLAAIVITVLVLGQFISNLATVLVVAPIAVTVSHTADISVLPMMMAITVSGAASFLTPVATAGNLMVQGPGGYRFGDYWRLGLPCIALFGAVAIFIVPLIWPF